jgi:hypothetical protein
MKVMRYLAAVLILLCAIAGVQAATIVVAPSGGDYATLQEAVDAASAGDIIELRAGSYPGGVAVAKTVTILGDEGAVIGSGTDQAGLMIEADGVAVTGVGIEGPATGIFLRNSAEFSVRQCSFVQLDVGIVAEGCSNGTVEGNSFASVGAAFLGMGTTGTTVSDSSFADVTQYIQFYASSGCRVEAESLQGPEYFAADIFSDTKYECGPWTATGWDFALLGVAYQAPAGYTLAGEAANISFIEKAESSRMPEAVLSASFETEDAELYGFYRVDARSPALVSETTVDNGTALIEATISEAGHYALMERPAGGGEVVIAGIAVLVIAALLIVVLLRRRK